jgi:hypothetical protein
MDAVRQFLHGLALANPASMPVHYWIKSLRGLMAILMAVTCLMAQQSLADSEDPESSVDYYLESDRGYNVTRRLRTEQMRENNLMSDEAKEAVRILLFEASAEQLGEHLVLSQFLNPDDLKRVQSAKGKFIIPCRASDRLAAFYLRMRFGKPVAETLGYKVLSRTTHYIEPVGNMGGFFAKFSKPAPGADSTIEREVLTNDYINARLQDLPPQMRDLSMDSFMGINLSFLGIPIAIAYRSAERIRGRPDHIRVYPGHGILGCDECVLDYAKKWSGDFDDQKAVGKWKDQELIPKIAQYIAQAHHVLGVSFEAHTQNMVFEIDHNTGEILKIHFRDFGDVLLNPVPLIAEGRFPKNLNWHRLNLIQMHTNYFSDAHAFVAKDIWYHTALYTGQAVTSHVNGFQRQQRYLLTFLRAYLAETEKIFGEKIELPPQAEEVLKNLEDRKLKEGSGELQERSHLRNAMASVLKPVFEQILAKKSAKIQAALDQIHEERDQEILKKEFYKSMTRQRVVFMGSDEHTRLMGETTKNSWLHYTIAAKLGFGLRKRGNLEGVEFKVYDGRIFAIEIETRKPLGMAMETFVKSDDSKATPVIRSIIREEKSSLGAQGICRSAQRR